MSLAARALIPVLAGFSCSAADDPDLLSRIRLHMRDYLARLPDYTCRVTIERTTRRTSRAPFDPIDRLRLEIAYSNGHEYYAWPGDDRFENTIDELLPEHGLVSEGSYALHSRKLFLTNDAQFVPPRTADCDAAPCVHVDFVVPVSRSGFAISAGGASAPVALHGAVWFHSDTLDILRLEVRVEDTPRSVRIAGTREVTTYTRARIGDVDFVLPRESVLVLRDRDGSERRNRSTFDDFHRYAGTSTVRYGPAPVDPPGPVPTPRPVEARVPRGVRITATLDAGLPLNVAVGDVFTASGGVTGRVTDLRRAGDRWSIELSLLKVGDAKANGVVRRVVQLPLPSGASFTWKTE